MVFTRILRNLIRDKELGPRIVPIIPDEARTFGMDPLFKEVGIYAALGQRYEPVDSDLVLSYREATDGQVLEEGITEAGSMASFQAAGTSYATHGHATIPFYIFYSMFGFQRTGDQMWAFGDARGRGFLMGATAGRTTLAGEGLQHDDGHSHVLASTHPVVRGYDPAFAYELAAIVRDGIERMYVKGEDLYYYISLYNENYAQPAKPDGVDEGILRGIYRFAEAPQVGKDAPPGPAWSARARSSTRSSPRATCWPSGSGSRRRSTAPRRSRCCAARRSRPSAGTASIPTPRTPRIPYVTTVLPGDGGPIVAATDWMKALPDMVARWLPAALPVARHGRVRAERHARGPAGAVRDRPAAHRGRDPRRAGALRCAWRPAKAAKAVRELGIDPDKLDPLAGLTYGAAAAASLGRRRLPGRGAPEPDDRQPGSPVSSPLLGVQPRRPRGRAG